MTLEIALLLAQDGISTGAIYVLVALGLTTDRALASLRFGLGRWTTEQEVDYAAAKVIDVVARLRAISPVGGK